MEIFNSSNIPMLKEGETIVPLFTLDTFLLPEDQMMMRVFEPRYKQMLDDIVLDGLPYGHVISNLSMPELNGISVPYDVGVLVEINQFQEQGSNLLYLASGGKRFRINSLIEPALEPEFFNSIFPSVDELVEEYIDEYPKGKLYVRGIVEIVPELTGEINSERWNYILSLWKSYIEIIAEINEMEVTDLDVDNEVNNMFPIPDVKSLWKLAALILDSIEAQTLSLKAENVEEICSLIESNIQKKIAAVRLFRQSNE
ncbi:MAG: hypothetical protein CL973_04110 [Euryarchaeota archaeon]|nr:hypothetical protein [Euryarchaeota archaeon]